MERSIRVVLVEQVVGGSPLDEPIRVIHPVRWWEEVELRAVSIASGHLFTPAWAMPRTADLAAA
jgi:hypothetical protein